MTVLFPAPLRPSRQTRSPRSMAKAGAVEERPARRRRSRRFGGKREACGGSYRGCAGARVRGCAGARVRGCAGARVRGCGMRGCAGRGYAGRGYSGRGCGRDLRAAFGRGHPLRAERLDRPAWRPANLRTPPSADARALTRGATKPGRRRTHRRAYGAVTSENRSGSTLAGPPTPTGGGAVRRRLGCALLRARRGCPREIARP